MQFPALSDLRKKARKRIPHFAFEYLDSGTGRELQVHRNRAALDDVLFIPNILKGTIDPDWTTSIMGQTFDVPFGIAPLGMSGVMWPGAERILAKAAARHNLPYCLSTVATKIPEDVGPHAQGNGWFQLYCPKDEEIRRDMLRRVKASGFTKLILTVDVPDDSRRERQRRANLSLPPKITARTIWEIMTHPRWAIGTLFEGPPRLRLAESYLDKAKSRSSLAHAGHLIRGAPDWDILNWLRDEWKGDLIVKGVSNPENVAPLKAAGVDAIWVSNHTGRQFEAGPATITQLPHIRSEAGSKMPIIFDSGVIGGLDIMRALALGADFVMMGRAWHYAVAAFADKGVDHLVHILKDDMRLNMAQIGAANLSDLPNCVIKPS